MATEHTVAVDAEDPEIRSIPTVEFPRAYELLERFVSNYERLLESGIIRVNQLRRERVDTANNPHPVSNTAVHSMESDMNTATVLKEVIGAQIHPEQLGNDAAA